MSDESLNRARAVKARVLAVFQPIAEVVGVGITKIGDAYGVKVNLRKQPAADTTLPESIEGVPLTVEIVGTIKKEWETSRQLDDGGSDHQPGPDD